MKSIDNPSALTSHGQASDAAREIALIAAATNILQTNVWEWFKMRQPVIRHRAAV
jgi:hypothetical protein